MRTPTFVAAAIVVGTFLLPANASAAGSIDALTFSDNALSALPAPQFALFGAPLDEEASPKLILALTEEEKRTLTLKKAEVAAEARKKRAEEICKGWDGTVKGRTPKIC